VPPQNDEHQPGEQAPQSGFLTWNGFCAWQRGDCPRPDDVIAAASLWSEESRTQVALKADAATAADGQLFTTRYLRLAPEVGLVVEIDGDVSDLGDQGMLHLGGDRRLARYHTINAIPWPAPPAGPTVALALSPTILAQADGRCPAAWLSHCHGLSIPGADPVSGWDLAANAGKGAPRPTRWALKSGSVWCLEGPCPRPSSMGLETDAGYGWMAYGAPAGRPQAT